MCFRWLPESARWLLVTGQAEKAHKCLAQCAKANGKTEAISGLDTEVKLEDDFASLQEENAYSVEVEGKEAGSVVREYRCGKGPGCLTKLASVTVTAA